MIKVRDIVNISEKLLYFKGWFTVHKIKKKDGMGRSIVPLGLPDDTFAPEWLTVIHNPTRLERLIYEL